MMKKLDYLVEISGNEALLERYIIAIEGDQCQADKNSYCAYHIANEAPFLNSAVVEYFFQTRSFNLSSYQAFFEKLRAVDASGFNGFSYDLKHWIKENITRKYFDCAEEDEEYLDLYSEKPVRNSVGFDWNDQDKLKFMCYIATCHMKFGASYESITAKDYLEIVNVLDPVEVQQLKQKGSGELNTNLTYYRDEQLECRANDAFGTIDIHAQDDSEQIYLKALTFINALLKTDFPRSFAINFESPSKHILSVPDLQLCGQHYLFAGAAQYANVHPLIVEYIELSSKKFEWYSNVDEEECAMPGTFAVFALALNDEKYFPVVEQYFKVVDDGHQSIQKHVTPVFVEKYGINEHSLPLFLRFIRSMHEHPPHPVFIQHFQNRENLELLLQYKEQFADHDWEYVLYSIFGRNSDSDHLSAEFSPELWEVYLKIREPRAEDFEPTNPFDFEEDEDEDFEEEDYTEEKK